MKEKMKKIIALFMILVVTASYNNISAYAKEYEDGVPVGTVTDAKMQEEEKEGEIYTDYNEFYKTQNNGLYEVTEIDLFEGVNDEANLASLVYFDTVEEAGKYYRECMVSRMENITFSLKYDGTKTATELYNDFRAIAFQETENANEGDYLYWNWELSRYKPTVNDGMVEFNIMCYYHSTKAQEEEIDVEVNRLLNTEFSGWRNRTDYENVKDIYDWITYTYSFIGGSSNHSSYSGFIKHETVCQGYATSFYRLAREMGISTRVIASETHGWNIVKLGDKYYNLDSTWDAQTRSDQWSYFLKCETNFGMNDEHARQSKYKTAAFNKAYPMTEKDYKMKTSDVGFEVLGTAHVQSYGWLGEVDSNNIIGTTGLSKRLEAVKLRLKKNTRYDLNIEIAGHVQSMGWTDDWIKEGNVCGTIGKGKRLEAIKIVLTGGDADKYDVFYQAHVQGYGWLGWAKNGESAGTEGLSRRVEAIKAVVLPKGKKPKGVVGYSFIQYGKNSVSYEPTDGLLYYKTHVQTYGWQNYVYDGSISGTYGESKRLEAISIGVNARDASTGVRYKTHIQTYGWEDEWKKNGEISGTSGQSKRLEAIKIELFGTMAVEYDIYYRVHAQSYGWLGWAKNGEPAGTEGLSKRLEAIQIVILPKGQTPTEGLGKVAFIK